MQLASHSLKGNAVSGDGTGKRKVVRSWESCLRSLQGLGGVVEVVSQKLLPSTPQQAHQTS